MNCPGSESHANHDPASRLHDGTPATTHLVRPSTPIKPKSHVERLFSTYIRFHHPVLMSIGRELAESMIGPMPVQQFLDDFLPVSCIPSYSQPPHHFKKHHTFQTTLDATDELKMYNPFIESMRQFAPQLAFVNTHARGDKANGYTFETKPDISIYHKSLGNRVPAACNSSLIEMHIEFKRYDWDDPFTCPPFPTRHETAFISSKPNETNTLGQIGAYAAAQLTSQFCMHCFSIYIILDTAHIIRWERDGAIVTEPIHYNTNSALVKFFSRFSQAPPELRGIDTTVYPAPLPEAECACNKLNLPKDTPMFQTTVPGHKDGSPFPIIFAHPDTNSTTPFCHATHACPAYDPIGDRMVFFKDSWCVDANDIIPEGEIYTELTANNVPHVPHCLASGDVESEPKQKTQMQKCSQYDWACQKGLAITPHIHYHLILDLIREALTNFSSSMELVQAIHYALIAHEAAYAVGYLHQDLSPGNIIIVGGSGYLIDWDFAKSTKTEAPHRITCMGTWPFMSTNLIEDASAAHTFQDDLESSLWLLLWTTIMFTQSSLSIEQCSKFMRETFELGGQQKQSVLLSQTILNHDTYCDNFPNDLQPPLFPNRCSLYLLLRDLADLFCNHYWKPELADWQTLATVEKFVAAQGDVMQDIRENLPAYHYQQFQKRLQDHRYTIECFAHHLQWNDWPQGDKAVKQELTQVDFWEMEGMSKVTLLQSKHILESVDAEEEKQPRPKKARQAQPSQPQVQRT